jgi:hypothetical protein
MKHTNSQSAAPGETMTASKADVLIFQISVEPEKFSVTLGKSEISPQVNAKIEIYHLPPAK